MPVVLAKGETGVKHAVQKTLEARGHHAPPVRKDKDQMLRPVDQVAGFSKVRLQRLAGRRAGGDIRVKMHLGQIKHFDRASGSPRARDIGCSQPCAQTVSPGVPDDHQNPRRISCAGLGGRCLARTQAARRVGRGAVHRADGGACVLGHGYSFNGHCGLNIRCSGLFPLQGFSLRAFTGTAGTKGPVRQLATDSTTAGNLVSCHPVAARPRHPARQIRLSHLPTKFCAGPRPM